MPASGILEEEHRSSERCSKEHMKASVCEEEFCLESLI